MDEFRLWGRICAPSTVVAAADRSLRLDGWCLILRILLLPPELIVYPHCVWRKKKSDEPEAVPRYMRNIIMRLETMQEFPYDKSCHP